MPHLDDILSRLEELLAEIESLDEPLKSQIFELLDGIDLLHRMGLSAVADVVGSEVLERLRQDPAAAWMLDAYGVGVDQVAIADAALEEIRPYIHSHGGKVEVLGVELGVVRLRMSGACAGCTASAVTLREGVEEALRNNFPAFVGVEVEEDDAAPHPPPAGPSLLQIQLGPPS